MPKQWRYYEGTSSANTIIKDLAKVMCTAVKDDPIYDEAGNLVKSSKIIQERNWDVIYPIVNMDVITGIDRNDLSPEDFLAKIEDQLARSTDTVILKTKTTPVDLDLINNSGDDIGLENDLGVRSIDMYVELYKPKYMADPEKNNPEVERYGIKPYNVTQDIYRAYASTTGNREYKLLDDSAIANDPTKVAKTTLVTTAPGISAYSCFSSYFAASESSQTKLLRQIFTWKGYVIGTTMPSSAKIDDSVTVTNASLDTVPADVKASITAMYGVDLTEYQTLSVTVATYVNDIYSSSYGYNNKYVVSIAVKKTNDVYKLLQVTTGASGAITGGLHFVLPDPIDKIKVSTIKFFIGTSEQPATSYNVDMTSGEFILKNTIPSSGAGLNADSDGVPIITYTYEKDAATVTGGKLLYNNHYIYVRMFDIIEDDQSSASYLKAPKKNDVDPSTGEIIKLNSHVSEWAKLSWYQDYEEILKDELDDDVGESDLSQGVKFLPIETPGLNGDTRIRFWVNTNNDRVVAVLMGNPSLDFSANRHLTSVLYLGRIESFENSINDTAGNFALFTSASTNPCATKTISNRVTQTDEKTIGSGTDTGSGTGIRVFDLTPPKDKFIDTNASMSVKLVDVSTTPATETMLDAGMYSVIVAEDKTKATITLGSAPAMGLQVIAMYSYYSETVENVDGIIRDDFGNILEIRYPDTWGKNTATGVTDVAMLHTRSKAYFQKHHFMFTTTEEYMTKEMYGKSAYTGEYYADRIKITHGNDGPRGMLQDVLVIDQSSLVALDELIVNRDFSKDASKQEETYVFFPVNANFSPFAGSPNAMYGLAVKKDFKLPAPVDDAEAVARAVEDLYIGKLTNITDDIYLPTEYADGVTITWTSSDATTIATA